MSHRFFRASHASFEIVNAFLTTIIQKGDGTWFNLETCPLFEEKRYWNHQYDAEPDGKGEAIEKGTFGARYVTGLLAPEYTPPNDIEEITYQQYLAAFPPAEM